MKPFTCILFLLALYSVKAQDSTRVESPIIVAKLVFGAQFEHNDTMLKFVDVINDSRCPKGTTCVRAGEAKVLIALYKNGIFIENKVIDITPTTHLYGDVAPLITSDQITIKGFNLLPYPQFGVVVNKEEYVFQIVVED